LSYHKKAQTFLASKFNDKNSETPIISNDLLWQGHSFSILVQKKQDGWVFFPIVHFVSNFPQREYT
jgi:hypothetical protein